MDVDNFYLRPSDTHVFKTKPYISSLSYCVLVDIKYFLFGRSADRCIHTSQRTEVLYLFMFTINLINKKYG